MGRSKPMWVDDAPRRTATYCQVYDVYLQRLRNLDYLEAELDECNKKEEERAQEAERKFKVRTAMLPHRDSRGTLPHAILSHRPAHRR